jgi:hypothetical protein
MNLPNQKLKELLEAVEQINPEIADYWQATAIIESLGYTDRIIQKEFNFPDALSIGKYIYQCHSPSLLQKASSSSISFQKTITQELQIFIDQFSRSFVYAIPLILMLFLEYLGLNNKAQFLPPQLASLLTLSTLGSLCASGGFVQMISRRGEFYMSLGEPLQAQRVCIPIFYLGSATSIIVGFFGLLFSFYRNIFDDEYLILAAIYYLLLSILWMLVAIISIQFPPGSSIALLGLSGIFLVLNIGIKLGAFEAQILATLITLTIIIAIVVIALKKGKNFNNTEIKLPRLSALVYLLAPYFFYGIGYFGFIFADRLVAGWAIPQSSGLIFAINTDYQRQMDLALLNFLLIVPLVEYLSYKYIRYWFNQVKKLTSIKIQAFAKKLQLRYGLVIILMLLFFLLSTFLTLNGLKPITWGMKEISQSLLGCLGYLFFAIGLLNAILLFSLDRAREVLSPLAIGLIINLTVGYLLTHLFDASYAVMGLVAGAIAFMVLSTRQIFQAIQHPDYAYYLGGY